MLLLIAYDPDGSDDVSKEAAAAINAKAKESREPLERCWLAETEQDEDIDDWADALGTIVEPGSLLILRVRGRINGQLREDDWAWINPRAV
jgi:hypothetical protein